MQRQMDHQPQQVYEDTVGYTPASRQGHADVLHMLVQAKADSGKAALNARPFHGG
jgi:hypothetical protein